MKSAVKAALRSAAEQASDLPFTLTPGERLTVPRFAKSVGFYEMPVVVLQVLTDGPARGALTKLPDGTVTLFRSMSLLEQATPLQWAQALWRYAGIRAAGGAS